MVHHEHSTAQPPSIWGRRNHTAKKSCFAVLFCIFSVLAPLRKLYYFSTWWREHLHLHYLCISWMVIYLCLSMSSEGRSSWASCCHCQPSQCLCWVRINYPSFFASKTFPQTTFWRATAVLETCWFLWKSLEFQLQIWGSPWARTSFSHTIKGGESSRSGSRAPLPFTVKVWEMPSNLCDSLWSHKSVGCWDIFRCLLLVADKQSVSCLPARKIIQEMNAAYLESKKCCRVKFFISSKSLINIYTSRISTRIQVIHTIFYLFCAGAPTSVYFPFPTLLYWKHPVPFLLGSKDICLVLRCSLE